MKEARLAKLFDIVSPNLLLAIVSIALFIGTFGHWCEYWGDSGFNLYTIWQISKGKVLYHELGYFHGPLSPYLNAFVFKFFGESILSIAIFNLIQTWLIACMIFSLVNWLSERITAFLAAVYFLCAFAFSQVLLNTSFNFIFPYKPEALHGTFIAFACFILLKKYLSKNKNLYLFPLFFLWSCCLLLSLETFVAISVGICVCLSVSKEAVYYLKKNLWISILGFALPISISTLYFYSFTSLRQALQDTFMQFYVPLHAPTVMHSPFYLQVSGFDFPLRNILSILKASLFVALQCFTIFLFSKFFKKWAYLLLLLWPIVILWPIINSPAEVPWWTYARIFPFSSAIFLIFVIRDFWIHKAQNNGLDQRLPLLLGFLFFSFSLLSKMILNPRIGHYGFFLAMPAGIAMVLFFCSYLPIRFTRMQKNGIFLRYFFLSCIGSITIAHVFITFYACSWSNTMIGRGGDLGYALGEPESNIASINFIAAESWAEKNISPSDSLLMLPCGEIINYLARRNRSTRFSFDPFTIGPYGVYKEDFLLRELRQKRPEYIGFISNHLSIMGVGIFGVDPKYGLATRKWVEKNYTPVHKQRGSPFVDGSATVWFYARNKNTPPFQNVRLLSELPYSF